MRIFTLLSVLIPLTTHHDKPVKITQMVKHAVEDSLNKTNVLRCIQKCKIKFPHTVFKQCMLESGNLKSRICLENHNLFGMRLPTQRKTLAVGERYGFAVYKTWEESIEDYALWQHRMKDTVKDYGAFLQRVSYDTDRTYAAKF